MEETSYTESHRYNWKIFLKGGGKKVIKYNLKRPSMPSPLQIRTW